jgi:hypothetical protein
VSKVLDVTSPDSDTPVAEDGFHSIKVGLSVYSRVNESPFGGHEGIPK